LNSALNEDQERFTTLIQDPRLTPSVMLEVMSNAMGLEPDLRLARPSDSRKAPIGGAGLIAAWPAGALQSVIAANGLGTLCDALEERLALFPMMRRRLDP